MAAALLIEDERGTYTGHSHAHNGYYAGDFFGRQDPEPPVTHSHTRPTLRVSPTGYSSPTTTSLR